jgi:hypothetical protein
MSQPDPPADPEIDAAAKQAARDCVWIIQAVLREEEVIDAAREFYRVIREHMETLEVTRRQPGRRGGHAPP